MHACLAEQALNTGDLGVAAAEVTDGLGVLAGADLAEEEIRLLAAGARLAADLAALPGSARPRDIRTMGATGGHLPEKASLIAADHGAGQPDLAAFGAMVAAEDARRAAGDTRATWRSVAEAWRAAGRPYREAYARLREAGAAIRAGRREQAIRALAACQDLARELEAAPVLTQAGELALSGQAGAGRGSSGPLRES